MIIFSVFAAIVELAGQLQITHDADRYLAFGERGEVVLADGVHIYLYQHDGAKYSLTRMASLPDGVESYCNKAVSETTVFLRDFHLSSPTHKLHITDLHHMGTLDHMGELRGVLHPSTLVYDRKKANDEWTIVLHQPDGGMILQPPHGRSWNSGLSVCRAGDHILVVETFTQSMDAFSANGKIYIILPLLL